MYRIVSATPHELQRHRQYVTRLYRGILRAAAGIWDPVCQEYIVWRASSLFRENKDLADREQVQVQCNRARVSLLQIKEALAHDFDASVDLLEEAYGARGFFKDILRETIGHFNITWESRWVNLSLRPSKPYFGEHEPLGWLVKLPPRMREYYENCILYEYYIRVCFVQCSEAKVSNPVSGQKWNKMQPTTHPNSI